MIDQRKISKLFIGHDTPCILCYCETKKKMKKKKIKTKEIEERIRKKKRRTTRKEEKKNWQHTQE